MKRFLPLLLLLLLVPQHHAHAALSSGIVSYWKLDENTGSTFADSASTNNGTFGPNAPTWFTPAVINSGLHFLGFSSYATVPDAANLNPTAITINTWLRFSSISGYMAYGRKATNSGAAYSYQLYVKADGSGNGVLANYVTTGAGTPSVDGTAMTGMLANTWYMVTTTYDSTDGLKTYVNGTLAQSAAANGTIITTNTGAVQIGGDSFNNSFWLGDLDEYGIWSRALTASEVTQLYNTGTGLQYPFSTSSSVTHGIAYWLGRVFINGFTTIY